MVGDSFLDPSQQKNYLTVSSTITGFQEKMPRGGYSTHILRAPAIKILGAVSHEAVASGAKFTRLYQQPTHCHKFGKQ